MIRMSQTSRMEIANERCSLTVTQAIDDLGNSSISTIEKETAERRIGEKKIDAIHNANPASINMDLPKKVRWSKKVEKRYGMRAKDMPEQERASYWYTKSDDKKIFMAAKITVRMIMKGQPFDDIENCSRGLECKTMNESKKRCRNKKRVIHALMAEQELQRLEGVKNPERLAKSISKYTKEVVDSAVRMALEDEQEVQDYLTDARTDLQTNLTESLPSSE